MFSIEEIIMNPTIVKGGDEVELLLKVKNVGTKEAESVSIKAFKESSQPFEFDEKSDFIGKLKPGETGEAILKLTIDKETNAKTYLLDMEIRSVYNDEVLTENEVISIKIEENNNNSLSKIIIVVLIIIVILIGAYFFKKKSNHQKKSSKKS